MFLFHALDLRTRVLKAVARKVSYTNPSFPISSCWLLPMLYSDPILFSHRTVAICMVLLSYWHEENLGGSHTHFMVVFLFFSPSFVNNPKRTLSNGKARVKWEIVRNQSSERLFMVAIKCKKGFLHLVSNIAICLLQMDSLLHSYRSNLSSVRNIFQIYIKARMRTQNARGRVRLIKPWADKWDELECSEF